MRICMPALHPSCLLFGASIAHILIISGAHYTPPIGALECSPLEVQALTGTSDN